jgi:hypothetical protein
MPASASSFQKSGITKNYTRWPTENEHCQGERLLNAPWHLSVQFRRKFELFATMGVHEKGAPSAPFSFLGAFLRSRIGSRPACGRRLSRSGRVFDLAFPHNPLEGLLRVLDPVLEIGAIGRKQPHDLVGAIRDHVADGPGGEIDGLTKMELVFFQRDSPGAIDTELALFPCGYTPPISGNIAQKPTIAARIPFLVPNRPRRPSTLIYYPAISYGYRSGLE